MIVPIPYTAPMLEARQQKNLSRCLVQYRKFSPIYWGLESLAKGIFTTKVNPTYDDLPEVRYHFPKTYLRQAQATVGDWIIYYEPRRQGANAVGRGGRQVYFATARVQRIEAD